MTIARYTTPSITYKPSLTAVADIDEIILVVSQGDYSITKTLADAVVNDGKYYWDLTQEETGALVKGKKGDIKIDYLTNADKRYTTVKFFFDVSDSATDEVIS